MKCLQVNSFHHVRGGSDQVYFNTSGLLGARGHFVRNFAASDPKDPPSADARFFPAAKVGERHLRDLPAYIYSRQAKTKVSEFLAHHGQFDVAHLHIYYGRLTTSILNPLRAKCGAIVQTLHEYKLACPVYTLERDGNPCEICVTNGPLNAVRYRCKNGSFAASAAMYAEFRISRALGDISKIDTLICVSDFQRALLERAGVPETKLTTLHNFVDTTDIRVSRLSEKRSYILYFGRIEQLKGIKTLILAAKQSGAELVIAGDGTWTQQMKEQIKGTDVRYVGFQTGDALATLIREARAVVVPSEWYENCPMSVLEAKAAGTPVIGANIGGIPELIRDGVDGLLFPSGDVAALAKALERVAEADISEWGTAARKDIDARFSADQHYDRLVEIYRQAQAKRRSK